MEDELKALLAADIPDDLQQWMLNVGITSVRRMANWCDKKEDVEDTFIKASNLYANDRKVLAAMKMVWREADSLVQRTLKRSAEGVQEAPIDEPLNESVQKALDQAFTTRYHFDLPNYLRPSDTLLGRLKREFDRGLPTFIPLNKVKSAFTATRSAEVKRHRAGEMTIMIDAEQAEGKPSTRYRDVILRLEVLVNGWSLAGCYALQGQQQIMCEWALAVGYYRTLRNRTEVLLDGSAESAVTDYLVACEEAFRGHALDAVRRKDKPLSWGEALREVMDRYPIVWADHMGLLQKGGGAQSSGSHPPPPKPPPSSPGGNPRGTKLATKTHNAAGKLLCKPFNDSRTCTTPCKKGNVHGCDVELEKGGRACEQKHPRSMRDPAKHGQPACRPNI